MRYFRIMKKRKILKLTGFFYLSKVYRVLNQRFQLSIWSGSCSLLPLLELASTVLPKLAVLASMLPEFTMLNLAVPPEPWHAVRWIIAAMGNLVRALTVMACQLVSTVCGCSSCCTPS